VALWASFPSRSHSCLSLSASLFSSSSSGSTSGDGVTSPSSTQLTLWRQSCDLRPLPLHNALDQGMTNRRKILRSETRQSKQEMFFLFGLPEPRPAASRRDFRSCLLRPAGGDLSPETWCIYHLICALHSSTSRVVGLAFLIRFSSPFLVSESSEVPRLL
jgi:hypothetical protein